MIRSRTDELVATVLDQVLENYIQSRNVHIDKFRASVVYPFVDNDVSWPILEWTEGRDTEVLAIFEIDFYSEAAECSWLMHHGFESDLKLEDQPWKQTNVTWSVTNMSHLKTLFRVAQHILGILEWPAEDAHQLYCQEDRRDWSDEEYVSLTTCELTVADSVVRYGRLLFDHFSKIESLDTVFDAVLPALKHFSTEQGTLFANESLTSVTEYADGTHVSRYYGSVF